MNKPIFYLGDEQRDLILNVASEMNIRTQGELADKLGCSSGYFLRVLNGRVPVEDRLRYHIHRELKQDPRLEFLVIDLPDYVFKQQPQFIPDNLFERINRAYVRAPSGKRDMILRILRAVADRYDKIDDDGHPIEEEIVEGAIK